MQSNWLRKMRGYSGKAVVGVEKENTVKTGMKTSGDQGRSMDRIEHDE